MLSVEQPGQRMRVLDGWYNIRNGMNTDLNSTRKTAGAIDYVLYSQGRIPFEKWMDDWEPPVEQCPR